MKKLHTFIAIVLVSTASYFLQSCAVSGDLCSKEEIKKENFKTAEWFVLKDGVKIAELESIEWEFHKNKLYREISITLLDPEYTRHEKMVKLMSFIHYEYPNSKIEINNDKFILK